MTLLTAKELRRLFKRVTVSDNNCWLWEGMKSDNGYGLITLRGRTWRVHRATYTHFVETIPDGLVIDHLCNVKVCCNPAHMRVTTIVENVARWYRENPITHCPHGHEYANRYADGKCRPCTIARVTRYRRNKAAKQAEAINIP